ncbi:C50 carotenoid glucosyltransferase CrtX [soil metagenome]
MKVSIVIPVYNEEKFIAACLDSLITQEVPADEIIVVDNNSTDGTLDILKKYPIIILEEKKPGTIAARNCGFNKAQYDIIARTDADSILPPDWIKHIKRVMGDKTVAAVTGPAVFYDIILPQIATYSQIFIYFVLSRAFLRQNVLYGPNMAIRSSLWRKIKDSVSNNDREVHEDMDLAIHLAPLGKILYDKELKIYVSARRINHNLPSLLSDYLYRWMRTLVLEQQIMPGLSTKIKQVKNDHYDVYRH